jgi:hypothetical protein
MIADVDMQCRPPLRPLFILYILYIRKRHGKAVGLGGKKKAHDQKKKHRVLARLEIFSDHGLYTLYIHI